MGGGRPGTPSGPSGGPPGMPGCWKGMLGGGGDVILLSVMPRPSMMAWHMQGRRGSSRAQRHAAGSSVTPRGAAAKADDSGSCALSCSGDLQRARAAAAAAHQQHAAKDCRLERRPQPRAQLQEAARQRAGHDGVERVLLSGGAAGGGRGAAATAVERLLPPELLGASQRAAPSRRAALGSARTTRCRRRRRCWHAARSPSPIPVALPHLLPDVEAGAVKDREHEAPVGKVAAYPGRLSPDGLRVQTIV